VGKGDDFTTFIVPKVEKIWSLNLPETLRPPRPVVGHLYLYLLNINRNTDVLLPIVGANLYLHMNTVEWGIQTRKFGVKLYEFKPISRNLDLTSDM
jgi:hypothetical protein